MSSAINLNDISRACFKSLSDLENTLGLSERERKILINSHLANLKTFINYFLQEDKITGSEYQNNNILVNFLKTVFSLCYINNINLNDYINVNIHEDNSTDNK